MTNGPNDRVPRFDIDRRFRPRHPIAPPFYQIVAAPWVVFRYGHQITNESQEWIDGVAREKVFRRVLSRHGDRDRNGGRLGDEAAGGSCVEGEIGIT